MQKYAAAREQTIISLSENDILLAAGVKSA
jgi:hypothetical protein